MGVQVADRFEDVTPEETVRVNPKCDREVALFGYLRGANLKRGQRVHLAGVGDLDVTDITVRMRVRACLRDLPSTCVRHMCHPSISLYPFDRAARR
jgi:hypothetical protein